jgi:acetylornithine deacetylase/succinyl-diaminopimelate desuccinylase-like protein
MGNLTPMVERAAAARGTGPSRAEAAVERATPSEAELGPRAVELLRRLIRIDTSNPPGNERPAQELLATTLAEAGFECELLAAEPARPNLVARLRGASEGPTLCLLGHVDTVPAAPSEWTHGPWSGDLADGAVWGRGAQDMKDQVAAEVAAAAALARSGWRPVAGELLVVITADEEKGAGIGARWLCDEHPEKVRSDLVVNEGGGPWFELGGRRFYALSIAEKGVFRFRIRTRGRAGHASVPALGDNALLRMVPLLDRLRSQPEPVATPEGVAFLTAVVGEVAAEDGRDAAMAALESLRERAPLLADYLAEPMLGVTMSPTQASASEKENVIPSVAEVLVDCRVPPGMGEAEVRRAMERLLAPAGQAYEAEFVERVEGNSSPPESELADVIAAWVAESDPGAELAPIVMPGFSDSHWFRTAFPEAAVYGFCPQRGMSMLEAAPLVHSADERILVEDVEYATRFFYDLPRRVLG